MNNRPVWFAAILLTMLAVLMVSHLALMWESVRECARYADILLDQAKRLAETSNEQVVIRAVNEQCNAVEDNFSKVAGQYIAVILALLSGAGYAAGTSSRRSDDPPR